MYTLDVLAYYLSKFSMIESKIINAILGQNLGFQVDTFDITEESGQLELRNELFKTKKFDKSEIEEIMTFKRKY